MQLVEPVNQIVYFFHWMFTRHLMPLKQSELVFDAVHNFYENDINN